MPFQDDGEGFAVGDDDRLNTSYRIDVPLFRELVVSRLEDIQNNDQFDPRIFGDRVSASLSPTYTETVDLDKREVHRRFQLVLDQIDDQFLRAQAAREVLELAQFLTDREDN